ncbi:MAG: adenine phosphoribosyltransferase [Oscillospiraceae bacterium]|jgi:adenine phosphoribosyltransferase|nr:adenine phosphoribosyltransferase [Oscillospiraceae bacterium]
MTENGWPTAWPVKLGDLQIELPLVTAPDGFQIYAFDSMGQTAWNLSAAAALIQQLAEIPFDVMITAESKAIALTEEMARLLGHERYVVLRKGKKLYMDNPLVVDVKSVTTTQPQRFFLGREQQRVLAGRRVCIVDDVISTGGTLEAVFSVAEQVGFEVVCVACVLTEETPWDKFHGIPVLRLDHIPLPAYAPHQR